MSWAAIASAVVVAGASAGVAAASAPDFANPAQSSRKTVLAALQALPHQRKLEMAARLGIPIDYLIPKGKHKVSIEEALEQGAISQTVYNAYKQKGIKDIKIPGGQPESADFTGYGDADIQGELSRQMAEVELELQKKYGKDFIAEALKQQEMADPAGTEARRMLFEEINAMTDQERARPVTDALDRQIEEELALGSGLSDDARGAVADTLARRGGTTLSADDIEAELEGGLAGESRKRARLQKALGYFGSGVTPEDVDYREDQQDMANMASFLGGRTPQSQFSSMAGGQKGATPVVQGAELPGVPQNLQGVAQAGALQNYQLGVKQAANQVSPWFMGLNAVAQGAQLAGKAGWQPFGQN
jgi:hypothetical protein